MGMLSVYKKRYFDKEPTILMALSDVLYASRRVKEIFKRSDYSKNQFFERFLQLQKSKINIILRRTIEDFERTLRFFYNESNISRAHFLTKDQNIWSFIQEKQHEITKELDEIKRLSIKGPRSEYELLLEYYFFDCHLALLLFSSNSMIELDYEEKYDDLLHKMLDKDGLYYRGHSDSNFKLTPSIYRNLKIKDQVIEINDLMKLYKESGLADKYCEIRKKQPFVIDYDFLAYIQHSCSYSPLLDFTSDEDVAKVFATYETNYNSRMFNDATLYVFQPHKMFEEPIDSCLKDFRVSYHQEELTYESKIFGKEIWSCVMDDFRPSYTFNLDEKSNDRMIYQKGSFLFVYKCVVANGRICTTFDTGFFIKMDIKCKNKNGMYHNIVRHRPYLEYRYLLDPYLYLSECNKKAVRLRRKKNAVTKKP